jgi:prepilin-type N-terminal cleavage/methylation domain-containing protein|tara:strand:- start:122 stop:601 length:480 start_codon:yes stop_codon:yes gene_type:complete
MKQTKQTGFTLIELIIVMVILGIMAAVAVPRYLNSIANAEEAAENAVISNIMAGLKQYANNQFYTNGRAVWPDNPLSDKVLSEPLENYDATDDGQQGDIANFDGVADKDGEWTFDIINSKITHQRSDNTRYSWAYNKGVQTGDLAAIGTLGERDTIPNN